MNNIGLRAMRRVREEADRLRFACVTAQEQTAMTMHLAYDRRNVHDLPRDQAALLGRLNRIK